MRAAAGDVRVFEGHAFIVEAAVSLGGRELRPGINVYRFANRIPLLFEGGSDVITRTATKRINWGSYKINQSSDRVRAIGVMLTVSHFAWHKTQQVQTLSSLWQRHWACYERNFVHHFKSKRFNALMQCNRRWACSSQLCPPRSPSRAPARSTPASLLLH